MALELALSLQRYCCMRLPNIKRLRKKLRKLFCSYTPPINVYDAENLCYEKGIFVLEFLPTKIARQKYAGIVVASDAMRCDAMRILSPGIFAVKRILSAISTLSSTALHYSAFLGNCQKNGLFLYYELIRKRFCPRKDSRDKRGNDKNNRQRP